jgi:hypothetical protein
MSGHGHVTPNAEWRFSEAQTEDAAIEMAKDLVMYNFSPLLESLQDRRHETEKRGAFYRFIVALHAARGEAEEFRKAHIAEGTAALRAQMEDQFRERLREIDAMTPGEETRGVS